MDWTFLHSAGRGTSARSKCRTPDVETPGWTRSSCYGGTRVTGAEPAFAYAVASLVAGGCQDPDVVDHEEPQTCVGPGCFSGVYWVGDVEPEHRPGHDYRLHLELCQNGDCRSFALTFDPAQAVGGITGGSVTTDYRTEVWCWLSLGLPVSRLECWFELPMKDLVDGDRCELTVIDANTSEQLARVVSTVSYEERHVCETSTPTCRFGSLVAEQPD
jgi:hypothetical protein